MARKPQYIVMLQASRYCSPQCVSSAHAHLLHTDLVDNSFAFNRLLDANFHGMVCDFGMSRNIANNDDYYTASQAKVGRGKAYACCRNFILGRQVPLRWTAPEAVVRRKFSEQSGISS